MIIRPAQEADVDAIGQLWLGLVMFHRQIDDEMPLAADDGAARYAERIRYGLSDSYYQVYVAEQAGELLGYVYGVVMDLLPEMFVAERAGMIGDIFVKPEHRSKGVGRALMQVMKDWFKLRGVSHYELTVAVANEGGVRFWTDAMHGRAVVLRIRAAVDSPENSAS